MTRLEIAKTENTVKGKLTSSGLDLSGLLGGSLGDLPRLGDGQLGNALLGLALVLSGGLLLVGLEAIPLLDQSIQGLLKVSRRSGDNNLKLQLSSQ